MAAAASAAAAVAATATATCDVELPTQVPLHLRVSTAAASIGVSTAAAAAAAAAAVAPHARHRDGHSNLHCRRLTRARRHAQHAGRLALSLALHLPVAICVASAAAAASAASAAFAAFAASAASTACTACAACAASTASAASAAYTACAASAASRRLTCARRHAQHHGRRALPLTLRSHGARLSLPVHSTASRPPPLLRQRVQHRQRVQRRASHVGVVILLLLLLGALVAFAQRVLLHHLARRLRPRHRPRLLHSL